MLYLSDIPLLLTLARFAIWLVPRGRRIETGPAAVTLPLLGLAVLASLSVGWAPSQSTAADAALHRAALFGLYVALLNIGPAARWSAASLVAGAAGQGAIALAQFLRQQPLGLAWLGEIGLLSRGDCSWLRAAGLSAHANILGGYVAVALIAGLGLGATTNARRLAVAPALGLSLVGLLATASRSALLGLSAGLAILLIARYGLPGRRWLTPELGLAAAAAVIVVATLGGCATRRLKASRQPSDAGASTGSSNACRRTPAGRRRRRQLHDRLAASRPAKAELPLRAGPTSPRSSPPS